MPGDYTRFTHQPRKRYSGVLMQQGRVQLDADWNEEIEIVKRRWELQAVDTFGRATVPTSVPENASAFEMQWLGSDDLEIGVGRMYVDGLLAENFAAADPTQPAVSYRLQPFYPDPPVLPDFISPPNAAVDAESLWTLIYLDIWEREVTYVQDPELLEKALLGPDTATRLQTVWQVKFLERANCSTPLDDPSAGRLSSRAVQPPSSDDPCILPPSGGYRGLENRLYRVAVHTAGDGATLASLGLKWSRDNASIVAPVEAIDALDRKRITVARLGRDKVLRFKVDDRIEILDDRRELMETAGQMVRVAAVDEANRTLTLSDDVAPDFDAATAAHHTRIIRWDQTDNSGAPLSDGLVPGASGWIDLEDGVQIQLSLDAVQGGWFHAGDYWVFAARTADGSVEELSQAPPRGIVHHYAPLATLKKPDPGEKGPLPPDSCRHLCAPCLGDRGEDNDPPTQPTAEHAACCIVIDPEQNPNGLEQAIAELNKFKRGGCICLKAGIHKISKTLQLTTSNVVVHGESRGARVVSAGAVPIFVIGGAAASIENVAVTDISFELVQVPQPIPADPALIHIVGGRNIAIVNCGLTLAGESDFVIGIAAEKGSDVRMVGNTFERMMTAAFAAQTTALLIADNTIEAPAVALDTAMGAAFVTTMRGIWIAGGDSDAMPVQPSCRIEANRISGYPVAIVVEGQLRPCVVAGNQIFRLPLPDAAPAPGAIYAIHIESAHARIEANLINLPQPLFGGIHVVGANAQIECNQIFSADQPPGAAAPLGIHVEPSPKAASLPDHCVIRGNRLTGALNAIQVEGDEATDLIGTQVLENHIQLVRGPAPEVFAVALQHTRSSTIAGNHLSEVSVAIRLDGGGFNRIVGNYVGHAVQGLEIRAEADVEIADNNIEDIAKVGIAGQLLTGTASLSRNRLRSCGYGSGSGSVALEDLDDLRLESCEILNTELPLPAPTPPLAPLFGIQALIVRSCDIQGNRVLYADLGLPPNGAGYQALLLSRSAAPAADQPWSGMATIVDNAFTGAGSLPLVELQHQPPGDGKPQQGYEKLIFSNNRCEDWSPTHDQVNPPTVAFWGQHLIVIGNHVKAEPRCDSMDFNGCGVVCIGNVTTGKRVNAGSLPPFDAQFNVTL